MRARYISCSFVIVLALLIGASYSQAAVVNLLTNAGFESGKIDPWTTYGDAIKKEVVQQGAQEGKYCLHITTFKGANFWDGGLQYAWKAFEKGKKYTLATFLKSPNKLQINFKPELAKDPWTGYGDKAFTMTESWAEYYVTTPVMANEVTPASLTFHIAYNVGEFYIDNARFFEGDYVPPAPPTAVQPQAKLATAWGKIKAD